MNTVILVEEKIIEESKIYSSLACFIQHNEEYKKKKHKMEYKISRLKQPYEDSFVRVSRVELIKRRK